MNTHLEGSTFDDLLVAGAGWLLAACGGWAVLVLVAAVLEAASSGRVRATAWLGCPPALRGPLLALVGVALVATPGQASAVAGSGAPGPRRPTADLSLPVPARPLGGAAGPRIVVRPGDTLWHLAARRLPATATAAEVGRLVARLHATNRAVIGPDPDLIRPGQVLTLPRHLEENR